MMIFRLALLVSVLSSAPGAGTGVVIASAAHARAKLRQRARMLEGESYGGPFQPAQSAGLGMMAQTYGALRTSNNMVGNAVEHIMGIQGSLDAAKDDLSGEYALWKNKRDTMLADRDRLLSNAAKLESTLVQQKTMDSEKQRLQSELAFHMSEMAKDAALHNEAKQRWTLQRGAMRADVNIQQKQLQTIESTKVSVLANESQTTNGIRAQNRRIQQSIFDLNTQATKERDWIGKHKVQTSSQHEALLKQIQNMQEQVHALQKAVVAQGQIHAEEDHLAKQISEVVRQREMLLTRHRDCDREMKQFDQEIYAARDAFQASQVELRTCQEIDGANQKLQRQVNECRAALKSR